VLHFGDQCFVRFRCFGVLRCQHFHFRGDYGETAASFSGMCRLDGGIEGEQIGLPDNRSDEFYDVANAALPNCHTQQAACVGLFRLFHHISGNPG
jgi:hypothetical protein